MHRNVALITLSHQKDSRMLLPAAAQFSESVLFGFKWEALSNSS